MLSPTKKVLKEYKSLVVRVNNDLHVILVAKTTFEFLCDVQVVIGLIHIMPTLWAVHEFIKFTKTTIILFVILLEQLVVNSSMD
jgi:hypothetical protein